MRTTLDIDPVALAAARQLAAHRAQSLGQIVSELIHQALAQAPVASTANGFPVIGGSGPPITLDTLHGLEDED